jgi:hypothetical protein
MKMNIKFILQYLHTPSHVLFAHFIVDVLVNILKRRPKLEKMLLEGFSLFQTKFETVL